MRKLDIIIVSTVFDHATRIILDLTPRRVDKSLYYEAEIVDSTDPNVRQINRVKVSPEVFHLFERSRLYMISSDGYAKITRSLLRLLGLGTDTTWICVGRVETKDDYLIYHPEYSPDAVIVDFIDFNLKQIVAYIPDTKPREVELYIIDSDISEIYDSGRTRSILIRPGTILYASRYSIDYSHCVIGYIEGIKPTVHIVMGTLVYEGSVGYDRHYVRFLPSIDREKFQATLQGWRLIEVFGLTNVKDLNKFAQELEKIGIDIRTLILGAEYWREIAMRAEAKLRDILDSARQIGIQSIIQQAEQALDELKMWSEMSKRLKISIPYILSITSLATRSLEERG